MQLIGRRVHPNRYSRMLPNGTQIKSSLILESEPPRKTAKLESDCIENYSESTYYARHNFNTLYRKCAVPLLLITYVRGVTQ